MKFHASSLLYRNYAVGAHRSAECTRNALGHIGHLCGRMTLFVELIRCKNQQLLGADVNAKSASFTAVGIKSNLCHN